MSFDVFSMIDILSIIVIIDSFIYSAHIKIQAFVDLFSIIIQKFINPAQQRFIYYNTENLTMSTLFKLFRKLHTACFPVTPDYFIKQQNRSYTPEEILLSLHQMITGTRFSQQRSIKLLLKHLHCVLYYVCNAQAYHKQVQDFIEQNQSGLVASTLQVLRLYKEYLKKLVPTNSTYFHFLRDSQFYVHYIVVRYVLIVGDSHHLRKVGNVSLYSKINSELKTSIFSLLVEWLYELIEYRNSAIYYLISSTFILVCGLLGRSYENTFTLLEKPIQKDTFNKLMFIAIYILCDTTNNSKKNKYFLISMSISCLRKMLIQPNIPDIDIFIPSYLYADMIGFIHCPLTYEVVLRVLVSFLNEGFEKEKKRREKEERRMAMMEGLGDESNLSHSSENEYPTQQLFFVSPLTQINIWGVINLIIQKYGTYNPRVLQSFLTKITPTLQPQSIVRAYCIKLIEQLNLQSANLTLTSFFLTSQYDYCFDGKLLSIQLVIKNFRTFMQAIYSSYVQEAVVEKEVVLTGQGIFKYLVEFSVDEVREVMQEGGKRGGNNDEGSYKGSQQAMRSTGRRLQQTSKPEQLITSPQRMNKTRDFHTLSPSPQSYLHQSFHEQQLIVPAQVLQAKKPTQKAQVQEQIEPHQAKEIMFYQKRNNSQMHDNGNRSQQLVQESFYDQGMGI